MKVPTISSSVDTIITAVWGKPGTETTTPDYATNDSVWSNGFHGFGTWIKWQAIPLSDSSRMASMPFPSMELWLGPTDW